MSGKNWLILLLAILAVVTMVVVGVIFYNDAKQDDYYNQPEAKPVIYLYPEREMDVRVQIAYEGIITSTYPKYDGGWRVTAQPDGALTIDGREYYCLFWEGVRNERYEFETGFCVPGSETAAFLEDALTKLGLTEREANEFIIYWAPRMQNNAYNLISFQRPADALVIFPGPKTTIQVMMAWKAVDTEVEIKEQQLTAPERDGFTVVEWGGVEVVEDAS